MLRSEHLQNLMLLWSKATTLGPKKYSVFTAGLPTQTLPTGRHLDSSLKKEIKIGKSLKYSQWRRRYEDTVTELQSTSAMVEQTWGSVDALTSLSFHPWGYVHFCPEQSLCLAEPAVAMWCSVIFCNSC